MFRVELPVNHIHVTNVLMTLDAILFTCNIKKEASPVLLCVSFDFIGVQKESPVEFSLNQFCKIRTSRGKTAVELCRPLQQY